MIQFSRNPVLNSSTTLHNYWKRFGMVIGLLLTHNTV